MPRYLCHRKSQTNCWPTQYFPEAPAGTAVWTSALPLSVLTPRGGGGGEEHGSWWAGGRGQCRRGPCPLGTWSRIGRGVQPCLPVPHEPPLTSSWGLYWAQSSSLGKTHTHPPPLSSLPLLFSGSALWCSCSLTSDLIQTLSLAQPLRAQTVAACSQTAALKGTPRAFSPPPLCPREG